MNLSADRRTRILLVDDHPLVRAAVVQAIGGPDLEVVGEAGDARSGLELAISLQPDLVLLDIDLPDRSGLELLGELERRLPSARAVILTVSGAQSDLIEAIRLGAVGYITKDVAPEELLRSVRAARDGDRPIPPRLAAAAISQLAVRSPELPRGLDVLTDREREVLGLIASGETDRGAAAALAISTRTVEAHVGRILRKLGATNRAEAARAYRAMKPDDRAGSG